MGFRGGVLWGGGGGSFDVGVCVWGGSFVVGVSGGGELLLQIQSEIMLVGEGFTFYYKYKIRECCERCWQVSTLRINVQATEQRPDVFVPAACRVSATSPYRQTDRRTVQTAHLDSYSCTDMQFFFQIEFVNILINILKMAQRKVFTTLSTINSANKENEDQENSNFLERQDDEIVSVISNETF